MIAPCKQIPPRRRPSALRAARLAVADALLAPRHSHEVWRQASRLRRWLLVAFLVVLTLLTAWLTAWMLR
jgi:hypothetical protein